MGRHPIALLGLLLVGLATKTPGSLKECCTGGCGNLPPAYGRWAILALNLGALAPAARKISAHETQFLWHLEEGGPFFTAAEQPL